METEKKEQTFDLMELLYRFRRYWVILALCAMLVGGGAFLYTKLAITPLYEASCSLLVITRVDISENVTQDQLNSAETIIATYKQILLGRGFLSHVINKLGYNNGTMTVAELQKKVAVNTVTGTQIMSVAVRDPDPKRAARIASVIYEEAPDYIKAKGKIGAVEQVEAAQETKSPVYPSWKRNTAIGLLIGLLIPMAVIALQMFFENTYKSDADIRQDLDLPVLGVIPVMDFNKIAMEKEKEKRKEKGVDEG